jgi:hypothetical protein
MLWCRGRPTTFYQHIELYVFLPVNNPTKKIMTPATQPSNGDPGNKISWASPPGRRYLHVHMIPTSYTIITLYVWQLRPLAIMTQRVWTLHQFDAIFPSRACSSVIDVSVLSATLSRMNLFDSSEFCIWRDLRWPPPISDCPANVILTRTPFECVRLSCQFNFCAPFLSYWKDGMLYQNIKN